MGPSFALILLIFIVLAAVLFATLWLIPGWRMSLGLFAIYAAALTYVSLAPPLEVGQMERAVLALPGLRWPWRARLAPQCTSRAAEIERRPSR